MLGLFEYNRHLYQCFRDVFKMSSAKYRASCGFNSVGRTGHPLIADWLGVQSPGLNVHIVQCPHIAFDSYANTLHGNELPLVFGCGF